MAKKLESDNGRVTDESEETREARTEADADDAERGDDS